MTSWLITGIDGFVGRHFLQLLDGDMRREPANVLGFDRRIGEDLYSAYGFARLEPIDLTDRKAVEDRFLDFKPRYVVHLAAASSVGESWSDPPKTLLNNLSILLNLLEAARRQLGRFPESPCRILAVGSSEVYASSDKPLTEEAPLRPDSPYAIGRLTQEQLCKLYTDHFGLDIVSTRSFVHIGPGQRERFAVASFVRQLVQASRAKEGRVRLLTGNVDLVRDISDVRDMVRAYRLLLEQGRCGAIYNVCRSEGVRLRHVIEEIAAILELNAVIETDPAKLRPTDADSVIGSCARIRRDTGWEAKVPLRQTLCDMIDFAKSALVR